MEQEVGGGGNNMSAWVAVSKGHQNGDKIKKNY